MSKIKLANGTVYPIEDYAAQNCFSVRLESVDDVPMIIAEMTDENLSEIQFVTDTEEVNGVYHDKTYSHSIIGKDENGHFLSVRLTDTEAAVKARIAEYEAALRTVGVEV